MFHNFIAFSDLDLKPARGKNLEQKSQVTFFLFQGHSIKLSLLCSSGKSEISKLSK